jgi:hypothetical protein
MADISHVFGSDLGLSSTGDLATVDTPTLGQQRVLRRLLTNSGDYIWQLPYGAGLAQFVGQPAIPDVITAVIRTQMALESAVSVTPEPTINVTVNPDSSVFVSIQYVDATTQQTQNVKFTA